MKTVMRFMLIVVTLFSTSQFASAVAPRKPIGKLFGTAPDDCLVYLHSFGFTNPDPNSTNKTEQLYMEKSVQSFLTEARKLIDQGMELAINESARDKQVLMKELSGLGQAVMDRPFTFYLRDLQMGPAGPEYVDLGFVVDAGEEIDEITASLDRILAHFKTQGMPEQFVTQTKVAGLNCTRIGPPIEGGPAVFYAKQKSYFVLAAGSDSMTALVGNIRNPPPNWLDKAAKRTPVPRRWMIGHVNVDKAVETLLKTAPNADEARTAFKAMGLMDIPSASFSTGLDAEGMVTKAFVTTDSSKGFLKVFDGSGISTADLANVPKEVVNFAALQLDPSVVLETFLDTVRQVEPDEVEKMERQIAGASAAFGFDIRKELAAGLGDKWIVYATGQSLGMMMPDVVVSVNVRNYVGLRKALDVVEQMAVAQSEQLSIGKTTIGDLPAAYLKGALVTPTWCLTKDRLVVGLQKSSIASFLDSSPDPSSSFTSRPRVAKTLEQHNGPLFLSFSDSQASMSGMYAMIPMALNMAAGELEKKGIDFDATSLPPLKDILKHLDSSIGMARRTDDGIEFMTRQTVPSVGVGAGGPLLVALLLPAVQAAREAARRNGSLNNLRQIGLSVLNHESASLRFPAAAFGTGDKPGLSWRVQVLPYLEERALFEEFRHDEPWDSPHNKKLIARMPKVYRSPKSNAPEGYTNYLAVGGDDGIIIGEGKGITIGQVSDGVSKTAMLVEADDELAVPWTKPADFEWLPNDPAKGLGGMLVGEVFNVCFGDCHVMSVAKSVDPTVLKAIFTKSGGEQVPAGF